MLQNKDTFSSLELVELINQFREQEGNKTELRHDNFLQVIRDEFSDETGGLLNILETRYIHPQNKQEYPMYILDLKQSRQVLIRESKFVRKAVIEYIDKLEQPQLPKDYPEALRILADKAEREQRLIPENANQSKTLQEQAPRVLFAEAVASSNTSILVAELAKLITQNGVAIGQNRLFEWLRHNGYLAKNGARKNTPTQRAMEQGLFEIVERNVTNPDGSIRITITPKVTGKGQIYFINKFLGSKQEAK